MVSRTGGPLGCACPQVGRALPRSGIKLADGVRAVECRVEYMDMDDIRLEMETSRQLNEFPLVACETHIGRAARWAPRATFESLADIDMQLSSDSDSDTDDEWESPRPTPFRRNRYSLEVVILPKKTKSRVISKPTQPQAVAMRTPSMSPILDTPIKAPGRPSVVTPKRSHDPRACAPSPSPAASLRYVTEHAPCPAPTLEDVILSRLPAVQSLPVAPPSQREIELIDPRLRTAGFFNRVPIPADVFYDTWGKGVPQRQRLPTVLPSTEIPVTPRRDVVVPREDTVIPETPYPLPSRIGHSSLPWDSSTLPRSDTPSPDESQDSQSFSDLQTSTLDESPALPSRQPSTAAAATHVPVNGPKQLKPRPAKKRRAQHDSSCSAVDRQMISVDREPAGGCTDQSSPLEQPPDQTGPPETTNVQRGSAIRKLQRLTKKAAGADLDLHQSGPDFTAPVPQEEVITPVVRPSAPDEAPAHPLTAAETVTTPKTARVASKRARLSSDSLRALHSRDRCRRALKRRFLQASLRYETELRSLLRRQKTIRKLVPSRKTTGSRARSRTRSRARSLARGLAYSRTAFKRARRSSRSVLRL